MDRKIPDVSVKLVGEMLSLRTKVDPSQPYQSFAVSKHSEYFMLKSSDNEVYALVNELASQGLAALQDLSSVEIMAFAETAKIQSVLTKAKKPGEATLKVEINVYGSIDIAEVVGRKLGAAKLFLQDPDHGQQDIEYCNPHVVHFPGVEEPKPQSTDCVVPEVMSKPTRSLKQERETFDHTVSTIYDVLTRARHLERRDGGSHIKTPLLRYISRPDSLLFQSPLKVSQSVTTSGSTLISLCTDTNRLPYIS